MFWAELSHLSLLILHREEGILRTGQLVPPSNPSSWWLRVVLLQLIQVFMHLSWFTGSPRNAQLTATWRAVTFYIISLMLDRIFRWAPSDVSLLPLCQKQLCFKGSEVSPVCPACSGCLASLTFLFPFWGFVSSPLLPCLGEEKMVAEIWPHYLEEQCGHFGSDRLAWEILQNFCSSFSLNQEK